MNILTVTKLAAEAAMSTLLDVFLTTGAGGGGIAVPTALLTDPRLLVSSDMPLITECRRFTICPFEGEVLADP